MKNFTVGPVESSDKVRAIGGEQVPYFRTPEFSQIMLENEKLVLKFAQASKDSRCIFLTASGTGAMEAAIINALTTKDRALVVNGGSFGQRFLELLKLHNIPYTEIPLKPGKALTYEYLEPYNGKGYTAFLVNIHETSTGVLYNIDLIADFCRHNKLFLIVDAISSFLADEFNMEATGTGIMITSSQKALACPPGISLMCLSSIAQERINDNMCKCMYFDLKDAMNNMNRGQTPFTPAVGILLQINERLKEIDKAGGVETEIQRIGELAIYFREKIKELPFKIFSESLSNAVTPLQTLSISAHEIFNILKNDYKIWVCPNGGEMKDIMFRVGHIGNLSFDDYDLLIQAFRDMKKRLLI